MRLCDTVTVTLLDSTTDNRKGSYLLWDGLLWWRCALLDTSLSRSTQKNYLAGVVQLIKRGIIDPKTPITDVNDTWVCLVANSIRATGWTPHTQTYRITGVRAFAEHLKQFSPHPRQRPTAPDRTPEPHLITADAATLQDLLQIDTLPIEHWTTVIDTLWEISQRDAIAAATIWHTCQNLDSVLALRGQDIGKGEIHFQKTGMIKTIVPLTNLLHGCKGEPNEFVFRTKNGKPLRRNQIVRNIALAGKRAETGVRLTPKLWLATARLAHMPIINILNRVLEKTGEQNRQKLPQSL